MTLKPVTFKGRPYVVTWLLLTCVLVLPTQVFAEVKLSLGLYTSDRPTVLVKKFAPLTGRLAQKMSIELGEPVRIKFHISKTYAEGVQALVSGKVDFARLGPASYVLASNQNPEISILAIETKKGKKRFNGVICVRSDSDIHTVSDLKGKRFAFGSETSTIGRYLSQQYLLKHNIKSHDLKSYEYLGRHDKVGYGVSRGLYDAGALKESTFNKLVKKGQKIRALAKFENITKPWVARSGLDNHITDALQKVLLDLTDVEILDALNKDGFVKGTADDYVLIQQAIKSNGNFFQR